MERRNAERERERVCTWALKAVADNLTDTQQTTGSQPLLRGPQMMPQHTLSPPPKIRFIDIYVF